MMMKKGKKVEDVGLQLPEAIIQHIQSFLNAKEAAQTTLLSISWYAAWLTRPNFHFDWKDFGRDKIRFCNFTKKTVESYEKLNLKIHSLWLCAHDLDHSLVKELIIKALKMGATSLHLDLSSTFTLPYEVLESQNLIILYVKWCKIGVGADGKVGCSRLKSLSLDYVSVESDIVGDIISSCPLIENLSLSFWDKLTVESVFVVESPYIKLKCLQLYCVEVQPLFFKDLCSKFPCLKDLSAENCYGPYGYKEIQISSPSLERINFRYDKLVSAKFDVPCICKFSFSGSISPLLTFKTTKRNWECSIDLQYYNSVKPSWFLRLNTCLKNLSQSKVSLSLEFSSNERFGYFEDLQGLSKPEVENVTITGPHSLQPSIFFTLFQLCRPIYVTRKWLPEYGFVNENNGFNFTEIVHKIMVHQVSLSSCVAYQRMTGDLCDLEDVSVEFYDESILAWCPRLYDILISPEADHEQRLRLHLRWRY